jgi:hypothetical protein
MAMKDDVLTALEPLLSFLSTLDLKDPELQAQLDATFPLAGPELTALKRLVREGVEAKWLCERENGGVRYGRLAKDAHGFSIDTVRTPTPTGSSTSASPWTARRASTAAPRAGRCTPPTPGTCPPSRAG